ncbi:hypothetical protein HID58_034375 [Brassica napus]|uniref:Secreted protein n=1 Tax=Brassica napus TaxID=3708 RepID=A0ABQ8C201_BRANA|nr:hypothetical protein HID58_034375 [Brassica napus]
MCACAGAGKILLLHISFALLLCRLSPAFVLFSSLALDFSLSSRMVSSAGYVASSDGGWFPGPLRRRGDALPIPLKSDKLWTVVCNRVWYTVLFLARQGLWRSLLGGRLEISCSSSVDLLISDSPILSLPCSFARWRRLSLLKVAILVTHVDFIACHGFLIFCFSKLAKGVVIVVLVVAVSLLSPVHMPVLSLKKVFGGEFRSVFVTKRRMCNWAFGCTRFIDREAYEFRQIHREPITLEVTPEVPTSEARRSRLVIESKFSVLD